MILATNPVLAVESLYVGDDQVKSAIKKEFVEQGIDDDMDLEIFGGQSSFNIEGAKEAKLMVSKLKYDETQNKFNCQLEVFADSKPIARTQLQGRYYVLAEAFVPSQNIAKGTILKASDFKSVKIRSNRIKPNLMITLDKLVDMEAKRSLKEGKLISDREVGAIILIRKGDVITSIYKSENMQITAKALALNDGVKGQKIEAENTKSKKRMYGTVVDADTIEINVQ